MIQWKFTVLRFINASLVFSVMIYLIVDILIAKFSKICLYNLRGPAHKRILNLRIHPHELFHANVVITCLIIILFQINQEQSTHLILHNEKCKLFVIIILFHINCKRRSLSISPHFLRMINTTFLVIFILYTPSSSI